MYCMPFLRVVPPQNFTFCGADCGSTISLDLQQKLKPFLHSYQQQTKMRSFQIDLFFLSQIRG